MVYRRGGKGENTGSEPLVASNHPPSTERRPESLITGNSEMANLIRAHPTGAQRRLGRSKSGPRRWLRPSI